MKFRPEMLRLYAVTDRTWLKPGETLESAVEVMLQNGVTCVQLRDKTASHEELVADAKALKAVCSRYGVPFIVNDDVAAAKESDADGVHVGQSDMEMRHAREILGEDKIIGVSTHNVAEALAAQAAGADYLGSGAVFGSPTKPNATTLGCEALESICRAVELPVVAIGGITEENTAQLAGRGIAGVAVVSALFAKPDYAAAAREMRQLADLAAGE